MNGATENGVIAKSQRDSSRELKTQNGSNKVPGVEKSEITNTSKTCDTLPEIDSQGLEASKANNESASWLNWFSKSEIAKKKESNPGQQGGDAISADKDRPNDTISEALEDAPTSTKQRRNSEPNPASPNVQQEEAPRSWLTLWGNASTQTKSSSSASAFGVASNSLSDSNRAISEDGKSIVADLGPLSTSQPSQQSKNSPKPSYGWAFWSRDHSKSDDEKTPARSEVGELAPAGSSSQSKPESAVVDEPRGLSSKVGKRQRPQSLEVAEEPKKPRGTGDDAQKHSKPEIIPLAPRDKPIVGASSKEKRMPENLLLPSFRGTYSAVERPSLIQQISRLLQMSSSSQPRHVNVVQNPPCVKRALAIVSSA